MCLFSFNTIFYINWFGKSHCEQARKVSKTFSIVFDHIVNYKATFSNLVVASPGIFGHHFSDEFFDQAARQEKIQCVVL